MAWIETISFAAATGKLRMLYDRMAGPEKVVNNILQLHSLRPHSLEGHMTLCKSVLHNTGNSVPKWCLELIGVWVSILNGCAYCRDHHLAGMKRLLDDDARLQAIREALEAGDLSKVPVRQADRAALRYAEKLTRQPDSVEERDIKLLRDEGLSDGEILEINQVVAYFAYANRTVMGLGGSSAGEVLGLQPNNDADESDWRHS
ncbi:carboxymuconolactone decarboxylase family protein [Phaeobacter sp. HF9A]|uniref:carboxymuconolactone decarboxylase family protein n=1 Tax=Phaeobacter sp. HF9A TaxID=2721561 RepID=UPI0014318B09|nr:peroxidase-related enzyme [Phaeobacter sp. HF9A]NIZ15615.1 peroxidase-related enzyme [Phaeobacter sp. HF9A]